MNPEKIQNLFLLAKDLDIIDFDLKEGQSSFDYVSSMSVDEREFMKQKLLANLQTYENLKKSIIESKEESIDLNSEIKEEQKSINEMLLEANEKVQYEVENKLEYTAWEKYKKEINDRKNELKAPSKDLSDLMKKASEQKSLFTELNRKCQVAIKVQILCDKIWQGLI